METPSDKTGEGVGELFDLILSLKTLFVSFKLDHSAESLWPWLLNEPVVDEDEATPLIPVQKKVFDDIKTMIRDYRSAGRTFTMEHVHYIMTLVHKLQKKSLKGTPLDASLWHLPQAHERFLKQEGDGQFDCSVGFEHMGNLHGTLTYKFQCKEAPGNPAGRKCAFQKYTELLPMKSMINLLYMRLMISMVSRMYTVDEISKGSKTLFAKFHSATQRAYTTTPEEAGDRGDHFLIEGVDIPLLATGPFECPLPAKRRRAIHASGEPALPELTFSRRPASCVPRSQRAPTGVAAAPEMVGSRTSPPPRLSPFPRLSADSDSDSDEDALIEGLPSL